MKRMALPESFIFFIKERDQWIERHLNGDRPTERHNRIDCFGVPAIQEEQGQGILPPCDAIGSPVIGSSSHLQAVGENGQIEQGNDPEKSANEKIESRSFFNTVALIH